MKNTYSIFLAAAAVVSALVRSAVGDLFFSPADQSSTLPMITPQLVEQYAYAGATDEEIADRFLIDPAVMREQFAEVLRVARSLRRIQLRSLQLDVAKKLNSPMLIWLGRNELGNRIIRHRRVNRCRRLLRSKLQVQRKLYGLSNCGELCR